MKAPWQFPRIHDHEHLFFGPKGFLQSALHRRGYSRGSLQPHGCLSLPFGDQRLQLLVETCEILGVGKENTEMWIVRPQPL